jgi:hypothetical protein
VQGGTACIQGSSFFDQTDPSSAGVFAHCFQEHVSDAFAPPLPTFTKLVCIFNLLTLTQTRPSHDSVTAIATAAVAEAVAVAFTAATVEAPATGSVAMAVLLHIPS